jgi:hypothetical protein
VPDSHVGQLPPKRLYIAYFDWVDTEAAKVSRKAHTHELSEQGQHNLVSEGDEVLVVVNLLNKDHAITIGGVYGNVVGDCGEHLLLKCPRAWIEGYPITLVGEAPVWQYGLKEFTAWIKQDLDDLTTET